jgi:HSP20 family molecular chaperone IbpA
MRIVDTEHKKMEEFLSELDVGSRRMLLFLIQRKHASLDELTEVLGESSHMNTLVRIKNVVNSKSLDYFEKPVMQFEKQRIDKDNGKNILFNWWLSEGIDIATENKEEQFADFFDEENEVLIIFELKSIKEKDVNVDIKQDMVTISFRESNGAKHVQQIPLPENTDISAFRKQIQNQILIMTIPKI